jgi:hypothetical protein
METRLRMSFTLILMSLLVSACVTPYAPKGLLGGFSDMALAPDIYKVTFNGNGYTSQDTVQSYTLRRCAEIAVNHGFNYFILLAGNSSVERGYISSPTTIQSNSYGSFQGSGNIYGNPYYNNYSYTGSSYNHTFTTVNPGFVDEINKHSTTVIIKLLKSNKNVPMAFDAKVILSNYVTHNSN